MNGNQLLAGIMAGPSKQAEPPVSNRKDDNAPSTKTLDFHTMLAHICEMMQTAEKSSTESTRQLGKIAEESRSVNHLFKRLASLAAEELSDAELFESGSDSD